MPRNVKTDLCLGASQILFVLDATKLIIGMKISAKLNMYNNKYEKNQPFTRTRKKSEKIRMYSIFTLKKMRNLLTKIDLNFVIWSFFEKKKKNLTRKKSEKIRMYSILATKKVTLPVLLLNIFFQ